MSNYKLAHHNIIESALKNFNNDFLKVHNILFGGGTRIALELNEFRESIDIDFLCPNKESYRAARQEVTNVTLGQLVHEDFVYARDIRADRDAIRLFIQFKDTNIKVEFVNFTDYNLKPYERDYFPVPSINKASCFTTKLLANCDRYKSPPYKDIFDLVIMHEAWGDIPSESLIEADNHYGAVVIDNLKFALNDVISCTEKYRECAKNMSIDPIWFDNKFIASSKSLLESVEKVT